MGDLRNKLKAKYKVGNRYSNYGPCLRSIYIDGFRGIDKLDIELEFPVTAISGLNGAGKSTIGQLAVCAYKKPSTSESYKRQYVKDFFPISPADPTPIRPDAKVIYYYETDNKNKPQELTLSRKKSAWSDYKRQPERHCYYIGFTVYIPKVERRDLSVYAGAKIHITDIRELDPLVVTRMAKIIGHKYEGVNFQGISHKAKQSEIGVASRLGYSYSENNMGFGEGRILYTVDKLENAPEQSLFIIEEPETSLHESAQYELAKYLMDVSFRRHHQIILSTHSSIILNALPKEARKLLVRDKTGVDIRNGISTSQVRSVLSAGHVRELDVCVEDVFAKTLLTEVIRARKKELLKSLAIHAIGDKDAVREAVSLLRKTGKKAIAVRDPDVGAAPADHLYSFPGEKPPEREVYSKDKVADFLEEKYDIEIDWILEREDVKDHHKITDAIAQEVEAEEEVVRSLVIDAYIKEVGTEFDPLIVQIENEM